MEKQVKKEEDDKPVVKKEKGSKKSKAPKEPSEDVKDESIVKSKLAAKPKASTAGSESLDPEAEGEEEAGEEGLQEALSRPPPVHSDYLPLPWKGRLGYVSQLALLSVTLLTDCRPA